MKNLPYAYWGKTSQDQHSPYHLLPYHCLDVAAVGQVYLQQHKRLTALLAQRLGLSTDTFIAWQTFFLALHDVGKFSKRFQGMIQKWENAETYGERHDSLGWLLWSGVLQDDILVHSGLGTASGRVKRTAFDYWAQTITGHHGQPPATFWGSNPSPAINKQFDPADQAAALHFAQQCAEFLLPESLAEQPDFKQIRDNLKPLSWWLAGIAVLCDWLGSNQDLFKYQTAEMPLAEYWNKQALPQAKRALEHSGVIPLKTQLHGLSDLFQYLNPPTPLQLKSAEFPFSNSPQLFILEDVTGSGKTEAALMLAHRLVGEGYADGVYMGLPTMATSNAMFERIKQHNLHQQFWNEEAALLLAHSASKMRQPRPRDAILPSVPAENDYDKDEQSAATQRGAWLFDNRKKALLADFGVGTIDQALLSVIYSRHQALRLLGLSRKVLIVDEVHACDVYMQRLLEGVLEFQAAIAAPVILLSATLPQNTRQSLLNAYCKGLGCQSPELQETAYPLLTCVSPEGKQELPLDTRPEVARRVQVRLIHEPPTIIKQLKTIHANGQCACWIRNTVNDALDAIQALQDVGIPASHLDLFHARFALGDRLDIEDRVLERFGKNSQHAQRQGQILIATQVVEQSLDLDFDWLISDLAPIDLLIQRAGRLRRHSRDTQGNPATTEQRGTPELWVYSPALDGEPDEDWYENVFPKAAYVYKHHGQLWLTAKILEAQKAIEMPDSARDLIESVYNDEAWDCIPEALQNKTCAIEGQYLTQRAIAEQNLIKLNKGYSSPDFNFWDDTVTPTRLSDENSVTVRLARWDNEELVPWYTAERYAWELSQVNVRSSLMEDELESVKPYKEEQHDKGRWSKLLILQPEGNVWVGEALNGNGENVRVVYDTAVGLSIKTEN